MANPNYPDRKSIRLNGYDYSKNGLYFITLCWYDRICMFGDIQLEKSVSLNADGNNKQQIMILNNPGKIDNENMGSLALG